MVRYFRDDHPPAPERGESCAEMLPAAVLDYIREQGLYLTLLGPREKRYRNAIFHRLSEPVHEIVVSSPWRNRSQRCRVIQRPCPNALTPRGVAQARALGERLRPAPSIKYSVASWRGPGQRPICLATALFRVSAIPRSMRCFSATGRCVIIATSSEKMRKTMPPGVPTGSMRPHQRRKLSEFCPPRQRVYPNADRLLAIC